MKRLRIIFINGFVSSLTGLIMNGVGVWLNIYITKRAGAEVMGRFQLIMSVCSFAVTFAVSGISFATMRLIAEGLGRRDKSDLKKIMLKCFLYAAVFGGVAFVLLYSLSDILSAKFLNYKGAAQCLKAFSVSLPAVSVLAAISGYFTAVRRGYKDSGVKIFCQLARLVLTALTLGMMPGDPCFAVMTAAVIAELVGAVISVLLYSSDRKAHREGGTGAPGKILPIAIPIALSTYLRSGIMTVKNLFVPAGLIKYGMTSASAAAAFGLVHGIALPAVLFPSAFLFSFSALAVPELARVYSECENIYHSRRITYMINRSSQLTLLFSIFAAGFMFVFAEPVSAMISKNAETANYIRILAPVVPIMYLDNTVDNMLKGLNEQVSSMKFNIIDSSVSLLLVIFLLPKAGIYGYIFIIILAEIMNFVMSVRRLSQIAKFRIDLISQVLLPALAAVGACLTAQLLFPGVHVLLKGAVSILAYYLLANFTGSFTEDDRKWLRDSL